MRTVIAAAAALILGLFLGALPARRELAGVRAELDEARKNADRGTGMLPLALGMESLAAAQARGRADDPEAGRPGQPLPRFVKVRESESDSPSTPDAGAPTAGSGQGFATAKTALAFRAALSKAAFVDQAELGPDGAARLDATIAKMNKDLADVAARAAEALRSAKEKLRPRAMVDLGADLLDVYRRADDSFSAAFDPATRAIAEKTEFDLLSQIDLGVFEQLRDVMRARRNDGPGSAP